jgi:SAM-dependent methyltransferase
MGFEKTRPAPLSETVINDRYDEFEMIIDDRTNPYFEEDPYIQAYFFELGDALVASENLRDTFRMVIRAKPEFSAYDISNLAFRTSQLMEQEIDAHYPIGRDVHTGWQRHFDSIKDPKSYQHEEFTGHLFTNIVNSNRHERGKILPLVAFAYRMHRPLSVLEGGCSLNHNLKFLALRQQKGYRNCPFTPTKVMRHSPTDQQRTEEGWPAIPTVFDRELSLTVDAIINDPHFVISRGLGVDILDMDRDPNAIKWARSNSFKPSELKDRQRTQLFDEVTAFNPPNVDFYRADLTNFDQEKFEHTFPEKNTFDIGFLPTFMYLIDEAEHELVLNAFRQRLKPGGLLIVQDFIQMDTNGHIKKYEKWPSYTYGVYVWHSNAPERGWREFARVDHGRFRAVTFEVGKQALGAAS